MYKFTCTLAPLNDNITLQKRQKTFEQFCCKPIVRFVNFKTFSPISGILISRFSNQRVLDVSPEWTEDNNNSSHSSMQYAFRVTCDPSYFGSGCASLCRKRDDQFGHYTCSPTGERICLAGWQGDYCTERKYLHNSLILF